MGANLTNQTNDMAKINSRSKGQRGEREICKFLQEATNEVYDYHETPNAPVIERNQLQSNNGGYDLLGIDWLAPEVKMCETFLLDKWWDQTLRQCAPNQVPVLIYRKSRVKWRVRMLGSIFINRGGNSHGCIVDIALDDFRIWFQSSLSSRILNPNQT